MTAKGQLTTYKTFLPPLFTGNYHRLYCVDCIRGRSHIIKCTKARGGVEILLGVLQSVYITHFASGSVSIFQQFMGTTAPKRRAMSEITHPHAAHLPYLPEARQ